MSKHSLVLCALLIFCFMLSLHDSVALPQRQQQQRVQRAAAPGDAVEDLDAGAAADGEKDDLQGSASYGYGYYSYPYLGGGLGGLGGFYGGYYPYYSGYHGFGYPYYGGYYGGLHGYHGHYF